MNRKDDPFRQIVADTRQRLVQHESLQRQCCAKPEERAIHDYRIGTRRLLANLALLEPALPEERVRKSRKFLKRQLRATSKLRDLHVQHGLVCELARGRPALLPLAGKLVQKEKSTAATTVGKLTRRPDRQRRQELDAALAALEKTKNHRGIDARAVLERAFSELNRRRRGSGTDPKRLHRLRVALKHYRYLREAIRPDFATRPSSPLRRAQKCLGQLHDLALLEKRIRKHARRQRVQQPWRECLRRLARRRARRVQRQRGLVAAICLPHGAPRQPKSAGQIRLSKQQALRSGSPRFGLSCGQESRDPQPRRS